MCSHITKSFLKSNLVKSFHYSLKCINPSLLKESLGVLYEVQEKALYIYEDIRLLPSISERNVCRIFIKFGIEGLCKTSGKLDFS